MAGDERAWRTTSMSYLLGLDVGTTHLKAVIYDLEGRVVATALRPTATHHPRPQWAVYQPEEIWQGVAQAIREVLHQVGDPTQVEGLAAASMGEAGIPLDQAGEPLYPAIAWFDPRTLPQSQWWEERFGRYFVYRITGQTVYPYYSLLKLMWLRENEPRVFQQMKKWLCMEDFVNYRLTGAFATDYTIASRTMAFDQAKRAWSEEILGAVEVDPAIFPEIYPSGTVIGRVTARAAEETGLAPGTPVATGGHDHLCGALAAGVFQPGVLLDSTGTAEAVVTTLDAPILTEELCAAHYVCYSHVARGKYILLGHLNASGGSLEWFIEAFCQEEQRQAAESGRSVYELLMEQAWKEPGAAGLFLLPHLRGGGTPTVDPRSRGALLGLTTAHGKGEVAQAIIEATCYWLRENIEFCERILGRPIHEIRAIGGAVKNPRWLQAKADVTGRTVEVPALEEATCLGAALLAGIGVGLYHDEADAVGRVYRAEQRIEPDRARAERYDRLYNEIYREIYPRLRELNLKIYAAFELGGT